MARYDKYNPVSGGFRAPLAAAWTTDIATPIGVTLDGNGRVVKVSAGDTARGVLVVDSAKAAGDVVDVMTAGEIVDCTGLAAGTDYFTAADGTLANVFPAAGVNKIHVGHTVEASRLVVRVQKWQG
jgi:hypothetical protein